MPEQFQGKAIAQLRKTGSKKNTITTIHPMSLAICFLTVNGGLFRLVSYWGVGQLADRRTVNPEVGGSSPPAPASDF